MLRTDLLLLTEEDLADFSTRGTLKRALKEIERGSVEWEFRDDDGHLEVRWSDGPTTIIGVGDALPDASCSCAAVGLCRHVIRAVLVYQAANRDRAPDEVPTGVWDPGEIGDVVVEDLFGAGRLARLRKTFDDGLVVEVVRSEKPMARFHRLGHTVRFLVPMDPRYTQCDCDEKSPCRHVALAIWAFREAEGTVGAVVETGERGGPTSPEHLDPLEEVLRMLAQTGLANIPRTSVDRWRALARTTRQRGLAWPADILDDLCRQHEHYHAHDARFSIDALSDLVGELLIRIDALRTPDLPTPTLFVRGDVLASATSLGQSRFVGLGCSATIRHRSVVIRALLQDVSTGAVAAVSGSFNDPVDPEAVPEDLSVLAAKVAIGGRALSMIGSGQLVVRSAELRSDHSLSLGRSSASLYAQDYTWEKLRPPLLADGFREVASRIAALPPSSLRPRRHGEDLHVVPIADVETVRFDPRLQEVVAELLDPYGERVRLRHPYTARNRRGTERLLQLLSTRSKSFRFLAGTFSFGASGLCARPTALILEEDSGSGSARTMLQPWVDDMDHHLERASVELQPPSSSPRPLARYRELLSAFVGDVLLMGIGGAPPASHAELSGLAGALEQESAVALLEAPLSIATLLELAVVHRLGRELA